MKSFFKELHVERIQGAKILLSLQVVLHVGQVVILKFLPYHDKQNEERFKKKIMP